MISLQSESQCEILLDNFIETDLQMFLRPLNVLHYVFFSTKYSIRCSFITPNSRLANFIALCSSICFVIAYFTVIALNDSILRLDTVLLFLLMANLFLYALGYILNSFINIVQSDIHVKLIIKIKNIKKFITSSRINYKRLIIVNWIYVIFTVMFYSIIVLIYVQHSNFEVLYLFIALLLLLTDYNTIYMIRMNKLLRNIVDLWTSELKDEQLKIIDDGDVNEEARQKIYWDAKCKTFADIIDASYMFKELCQNSTLYHIGIFFMQLLDNIQYVIMSCTFNSVTGFLLLRTMKNITLLLMICFECEMLFTSLKNTKVLFLKLAADKNCTSKYQVFVIICIERLAYKRLLRGSRYEPLQACGMLTVDATLPLRFLSVLASYTAVLLQIQFS
nr:gustatory receptor 32 [Papilio glaucus]